MSSDWHAWLVLASIFLIIVAAPAFTIGWRRPQVQPRVAQYIVLISVIIFSVFAGLHPQLQRDWFTLTTGWFFGGIVGGFFGFAMIVKLAESLKLRYSKRESIANFLAKARKLLNS